MLSHFSDSSAGIRIVFLASCALEDTLDLIHQSVKGEIFKICVWKTFGNLFMHSS